jgi:hypothetical protein
MTARPNPPKISPVGSLVLSNVLFWGALFGFDWLHARWSDHIASGHGPMASDVLLEPQRLEPTAVSANSADRSRLLLAAATTPDLLVPADAQDAILPGSGQGDQPGQDDLPTARSLTLTQQLQRADGLGGLITLASLEEPRMPAAARAERLSWQRSSDPLSPLPLHWRDRIKHELPAQAKVGQAEVVRLPVAAVKQREELAILIDDSGEAVGLRQPQQQPVQAAVEAWAAQQQPSPVGTIRAVVIAAEPLL